MLIFLLFSLAHATDITVVNNTGTDMRIAEFHNKCTGFIVPRDKPVYLKKGERFTMKDVYPVVHTYTVCSNGLCSSSAMGVKDIKRYFLNVTLKDGIIDEQAMPEHFKTGNFKCPNETNK